MKVSLRCIGGVMHSEVVNVEIRDTLTLDVPYADYGRLLRSRYYNVGIGGTRYFVHEDVSPSDAKAWITKWREREERMK